MSESLPAETIAKPITPQEVGSAKRQYTPAAVFDAFNAEISLRYVDGRAKVLQEQIMARLQEAGHKRTEVFANGWLNVEAAYESAGWKVTYDKPGYNESGAAYFTFEAASK